MLWEDELLDGDLDIEAEDQQPRILALLEGVVSDNEDPEGKGRVIAVVRGPFDQGTLWLEPAQRGYLPPERGDRVVILFLQGRKENGIYWPLGAEESADQRMVRGDVLWTWMQSVSSYLSGLETWNKAHTHPDPVSGTTGAPVQAGTHPAPPSLPTEDDVLSKKWGIR